MTNCGYMPVPGTDFDPATDPPVPGDHPLLAGAEQAAAAQWGLDYAWQSDFPAQLVALLTANQAQFACRYLSDAVPGGKGIMAAEAQALIAAGIIIVPVWEVSGTDFTDGFPAGQADGQFAAQALRSIGAPAGSSVWFAIDTGTSDYQATNSYLTGAKQGTAEYIAQLYGSYGVVEAAAAAGLGSQHWQTYAWSGGKLSSHAAIYQYQNAVPIGGISMDRDRTLQPVTGPWARFSPAPAPPQAPPFPYQVSDYLGLESKDPHCHSGFNAADRPHIETWQQQMVRRGWVIRVSGVYDTPSAQVCRAFQSQKGLAVDGKVGPVTWKESWTAPVT